MSRYFAPGSNPPPLTAQAIIEQDGDQLRLQTTFDPAFVEALKQRIPPQGRTWDRQRRQWSIHAGWTAAVLALLSAYDYHIEDLRKRPRSWMCLSWCPTPAPVRIRAYYFATREQAEAAKARLDAVACGELCRRFHTVEQRAVPPAGRYNYKRWNPFMHQYQHWHGEAPPSARTPATWPDRDKPISDTLA